MKHESSFIAITTEGGLLPADFLAELLSPKAEIEGLAPTSYNLAEGERINEQVNRSWNRLKGRWTDFRKATADKSVGESTTTETRDRWLQPLFQELGYGQRLERAKPIEVDGKTYPVSHGWGHVPIHLVGTHTDLDRRTPGAVGAAKASPHSLVQQVLNASAEHLWGIASNGLTFRLLRDNIALTRQAYVDWDLAAIFDGDLYSEFFLFWLVAHQSRFDVERPEQCWLEKWKRQAEDKGLRALQKLRPGVARAIEELGVGLLSHPANKSLLQKLRSGELSTQDFYRQVLRLVYRIIFLFVAEERDLLHQPLPKPDAPKGDFDRALGARSRYEEFYSISRLRRLMLHRAGTPHSDLWQILQLITQKLGSDTGCPELALPALGSFLWEAARSTPDLNYVLVSNRSFLNAVHVLAFVQDGSIRRSIDYKNLGAEELGSVYEGLLELHPLINADTGTFELSTVAGNERKMSGSYYTPDSLVQCLLDSALEPVIADAVQGKQGAAVVDAILNLKVCDPAVGSGHFLIAAAHRLAKYAAAARSGEEQPSPSATRTALRDVIGRCLYGVDFNPMAAELCRVNLWLEALEPGKPLSFLDHHIRVGNSLLGTTPELISDGIPDEAFSAIEGDDKKACSALKKINAQERKGFGALFSEEDSAIRDRLRLVASAIDDIRDDRLEDIHRKEDAFRDAQKDGGFQKAWMLANLWCSAFVIKKRILESAAVSNQQTATIEVPAETQTGLFGTTEVKLKAKVRKTSASSSSSEIPYGITTQHLRDFVGDRVLPDGLLAESNRLADQYQFFQWHLMFPEVFVQGGFDAFLGNPPWEVLEDEEKKFFDQSRPDIAQAETAERKDLIERLNHEDPGLHEKWLAYRDERSRFKHFHRASGHFPLSSYKKLNLYSSMLENGLHLIRTCGYLGMVLQSGLATDESRKFLFQHLFDSKLLRSFLDFENTEGLFLGVHPQQKFSLVTVGKEPTEEPARFSFYNTRIEHLKEDERSFFMSAEDMKRVSPNTGACPTFANRRDAQAVLRIYRLAPVFHDDSQPTRWHLDFKQMFNSSSDNRFFKKISETPPSDSVDTLCHTLRVEGWLPVYEGKFMDNFSHRLATFQGRSAAEIARGSERDQTLLELENPHTYTLPRWWAPTRLVTASLSGYDPTPAWLFGFCDIANPQNARTACAAFLPFAGVSDTIWLLLGNESPDLVAALCAMTNSFVLDFVARRRIGSRHLKQFVFKQLPFPEPGRFTFPCPWGSNSTLREWLLPRVLELSYTAWDLQSFAQDCGWHAPPFRWDEERRFLLRCELDAAFFHLYLGSEEEWRQQHEALTQSFSTPRDAVSYIMDTFLIVKRKDETKFDGDYRTKRMILEIYDEMAQAMATGLPYQAHLDPSPANPVCCHPKKKLGILAFGSLINDPGEELREKIIMRIKTTTPFGVEFARYSGKTRGGAPTLVKHEAGSPVCAEILVLDDLVSVDEAKDMLWNRERRTIGSGEKYSEGSSQNSVLVREFTDSPSVASVLYTDFNLEGKIAAPTAAELAQQAIQSVSEAESGMDGITYLMNTIASGIETPLTSAYVDEILLRTETTSLSSALEKLITR